MNFFDLNNTSNQDYIKNNSNINFYFNNSRNKLENTTFKTIMTISHDKISHLCNSFKNDNNDNYTHISITQRNKHKFLTFIYYSPKREV